MSERPVRRTIAESRAHAAHAREERTRPLMRQSFQHDRHRHACRRGIATSGGHARRRPRPFEAFRVRVPHDRSTVDATTRLRHQDTGSRRHSCVCVARHDRDSILAASWNRCGLESTRDSHRPRVHGSPTRQAHRRSIDRSRPHRSHPHRSRDHAGRWHHGIASQGENAAAAVRCRSRRASGTMRVPARESQTLGHPRPPDRCTPHQARRRRSPVRSHLSEPSSVRSRLVCVRCRRARRHRSRPPAVGDASPQAVGDDATIHDPRPMACLPDRRRSGRDAGRRGDRPWRRPSLREVRQESNAGSMQTPARRQPLGRARPR